MRVARTFVTLSAQLLAGCAARAPEPSLAACGGQPDAMEGRVAEAPQDAPNLRAIADAHPFFHPSSPPFHTEVWVALSKGDSMLCRADSRGGTYVAGEWWIFHEANGSYQVVDHSGWLVQQ
jgi:hypothetical protein